MARNIHIWLGSKTRDILWEKAFTARGKRSHLATIGEGEIRCVITPTGGQGPSTYTVTCENGVKKGGFRMLGDAKQWAEQNVHG